MRWKLSIGRYSGIQVYLHPTFFLLLLWVAFSQLAGGNGVLGALVGVLYIASIFCCVVLHEFGHALAARKFGIATRDIILLPIGGVARLERIPREPLHELFVALAGPAVNLVIAAALFLFMVGSGAFGQTNDNPLLLHIFIERLMSVNIFLMVFNLLPAFPMDGGRILRAGLAMKGDYYRATRRAAQFGQGFAVLFAIGGLMTGNPMLLLIAFFVWVGAAQEVNMAETGSPPRVRPSQGDGDGDGWGPSSQKQDPPRKHCHLGQC